MTSIFEIFDKIQRRIRLTKERWNHIQQQHPRINNIEVLKKTLSAPIKIIPSIHDSERVKYYYSYNKYIRRYLFMVVKYLNGHGFIITCFYKRSIE